MSEPGHDAVWEAPCPPGASNRWSPAVRVVAERERDRAMDGRNLAGQSEDKIEWPAAKTALDCPSRAAELDRVLEYMYVFNQGLVLPPCAVGVHVPPLIFTKCGAFELPTRQGLCFVPRPGPDHTHLVQMCRL